jgi:hypothetical protein
LKKRSRNRTFLIYIVIVVLVVAAIGGGIWYFSGTKTPQKAAKLFVENWAGYNITGMKNVSTPEMADGMVTAYFQSILSSVQNMKQVTAESEGIPVASMDYPLKWASWRLHYKTLGDNEVEVTGSVNVLYSAYEDTSTITRDIHWIINTEKIGSNYYVSGVQILSDDPMEAVWTFMDSLMSRNMFYVKKVISAEPAEGLANYLASMNLEFTQGFATKGLFFVPAIAKTDSENKIHVSYTRVGISSSSQSTSLSSDVVIVDATYTTAKEGNNYVIKDVVFKEVGNE